MVSDRVLTPTELRALSGRNSGEGARRLAIHMALLLAIGWLVAISGLLTLVPAMLAFGLVQVALFAPAHEATHQTAFASRRANLIVGWLAACPSLLNLHFYTAFHFAHHRHTQIPGQDPELDLELPNNLGAYIRRILGVAYWRLRLLVIADCWRGDLSRYPYVLEQAAPSIIRSVRAMSVVMVGGSVVSAMLFGWQTPFVFWILPQLLCQPFLRAYVLAEHTGCTMDRNGLTNTRTTLTNAAVRLLMWNMPYHAEHHLYPSIPFHHLADAHALIRDKLGFVQRGYVRWNANVIQMLANRA
ncbi:MAG TPA: fatty acid desaturase [Acetobacteraceae bacterium]|nr:fatty acid desaturase [Acetobacteraceae bacterium]